MWHSIWPRGEISMCYSTQFPCALKHVLNLYQAIDFSDHCSSFCIFLAPPCPSPFPLSLYTECILDILKVIVMLGLGDLKMVDISVWNNKDIWAGRNSLLPYVISLFNLQISSLWTRRLSSHRQPQNETTATFHPSMRHLETGFSKGVLGNLSLFSGL